VLAANFEAQRRTLPPLSRSFVHGRNVLSSAPQMQYRHVGHSQERQVTLSTKRSEGFLG
jgi:hypothetical protein